ncbi:MAG: purine-nucleoside phosphorylase [Chloroflexi bacterium]|nr:purine-nucleoside phosphorylase [Chloroflexota bacterium]MCL5946863.1 purine-nucleoside phosphorylase [Chloroflexota bacterium]
MSEELAAAAAVLQQPHVKPTWGIILGSGFAPFLDAVKIIRSVPFAQVPGLARPSVQGHRGVFHLGEIEDIPIVIAEGRLHTYEGLSAVQATQPIRLLAQLGITHMLLTNAAGGVSSQFPAGSLMLIRDHINFLALTGSNPLRGPLAPDLERFVPMGNAYDPDLRTTFLRTAAELHIPLAEGVYAMVGGPSYETPAELHFLRTIGAEAVGMSTANEVIVARQLGLRVAAVSCISNSAFGPEAGSVTHHAVTEAVRSRVQDVVRLVRAVLPRCV